MLSAHGIDSREQSSTQLTHQHHFLPRSRLTHRRLAPKTQELSLLPKGPAIQQHPAADAYPVRSPIVCVPLSPRRDGLTPTTWNPQGIRINELGGHFLFYQRNEEYRYRNNVEDYRPPLSFWPRLLRRWYSVSDPALLWE
jgi:hypothetical protein